MGTRPKMSIGSALQLASLVLTFSNINWKGISMSIATVKSWAAKISWGKVVPAFCVLILLLVAVWDWRKAHTDLVEAKAAVTAITLQRDALALQVSADAAARKERQDILIELAEKQAQETETIKEAVEAEPEWSNQELPANLREALRGRR